MHENNLVSTLYKATVVNCLKWNWSALSACGVFQHIHFDIQGLTGLESEMTTATAVLQHLQHERIASTDKNG